LDCLDLNAKTLWFVFIAIYVVATQVAKALKKRQREQQRAAPPPPPPRHAQPPAPPPPPTFRAADVEATESEIDYDDAAQEGPSPAEQGATLREMIEAARREADEEQRVAEEVREAPAQVTLEELVAEVSRRWESHEPETYDAGAREPEVAAAPARGEAVPYDDLPVESLRHTPRHVPVPLEVELTPLPGIDLSPAAWRDAIVLQQVLAHRQRRGL
jgi:hypothetical protein